VNAGRAPLGWPMRIRVAVTTDDIRKILHERGVVPDCRHMRIGNSIVSNASEVVIWIECVDTEGG